MIADMVNFAIAGIGFCNAAGRLIWHRGLTAGMITVMAQNWTRPREPCRERNISALNRDS